MAAAPLAASAPAFMVSAPSSRMDRPNSFYAPPPTAAAPVVLSPFPAGFTAPEVMVPDTDSAPTSTSPTPPSSLSHTNGSAATLSSAKPHERGRTPQRSLALPIHTQILSPARSRERSVASSIGASGPSSPTTPVSPSLMFHQGSRMLQTGGQAERLSHDKTLEQYHRNAKKLQDPDMMYELAVLMVESSSKGVGQQPELNKDAIVLLRKIADRGHVDAQYFLADCYAKGLMSGKPQHEKAYPLFVLASKHGHAHAAFRAGNCTECGLGCMQSNHKSLRLYRKAAAEGHPGAMFRLGTAELNGELGLEKNAKGGVKWIKLAADLATPEFPQALHELALLHQRGIDNVVFHDDDYSCELLARAAELGYAPSAYKLGMNYEYAKMGCPSDPGLSIHMYNIAAQQDHPDACFALCAWYLVGAQGILPQSDTEAYLWAKKAAEHELAKAEYAVGYFTEMGIGTPKDRSQAKTWYNRALQHGDRRASSRINNLGHVSAAQLPHLNHVQTTHPATTDGKTYTVHTIQSYRNPLPQPGLVPDSRSRSQGPRVQHKKSWFRS